LLKARSLYQEVMAGVDELHVTSVDFDALNQYLDVIKEENAQQVRKPRRRMLLVFCACLLFVCLLVHRSFFFCVLCSCGLHMWIFYLIIACTIAYCY
jgi:hypothetical protein